MGFSAVAALFTAETVSAITVFEAMSTIGMTMTAVGAVTGNKSLLKLGGTIGLIGGVGGMVNSMTGAAANTALDESMRRGAKAALSDAPIENAFGDAVGNEAATAAGGAGLNTFEQQSMMDAGYNGVATAPTVTSSATPTTLPGMEDSGVFGQQPASAPAVAAPVDNPLGAPAVEAPSGAVEPDAPAGPQDVGKNFETAPTTTDSGATGTATQPYDASFDAKVNQFNGGSGVAGQLGTDNGWSIKDFWSKLKSEDKAKLVLGGVGMVGQAFGGMQTAALKEQELAMQRQKMEYGNANVGLRGVPLGIINQARTS